MAEPFNGYLVTRHAYNQHCKTCLHFIHYKFHNDKVTVYCSLEGDCQHLTD